jgi:predicted site-specific integrase-resolvase
MPVALNGRTYYRTAEACVMAGTSRNTLFRWIREGLFADVGIRDRKGWRLFTDEDVSRLKGEVNKIHQGFNPGKISYNG